MKAAFFKQMFGIDDITVNTEDCFVINIVGYPTKDKPGLAKAYEALLNGDEEKFDNTVRSEGGGKLEGKLLLAFARLWTGKEVISRFCKAYTVRQKTADNGEATLALETFSTPAGLEKRMMVKFASTRPLVKWANFAEYEVLEIKPQKQAAEFISYLDTHLSYGELRNAVNDPDWRERLSHVGGVYLINDNATGMNYVGSASAADGIWARWCQYAENPTGGNKLLVELLDEKNGRGDEDKQLSAEAYAAKYFKYSILEVLPLARKENEKAILAAESRWKEHLGTRAFGMNAN